MSMPIYRLLEGQAFDPDHCRTMGAAYEGLLKELGLKDRADPLCEVIAKKVIEFGKRGNPRSGGAASGADPGNYPALSVSAGNLD